MVAKPLSVVATSQVLILCTYWCTSCSVPCFSISADKRFLPTTVRLGPGHDMRNWQTNFLKTQTVWVDDDDDKNGALRKCNSFVDVQQAPWWLLWLYRQTVLHADESSPCLNALWQFSPVAARPLPERQACVNSKINMNIEIYNQAFDTLIAVACVVYARGIDAQPSFACMLLPLRCNCRACDVMLAQ